MKVNALVSEILKGDFMIDLAKVDEIYSIATQLIATKQFPDIESKVDFSAAYTMEIPNAENPKEKPSKYGVVNLLGGVMRYDSCCAQGSQSIAYDILRYFDNEEIKGIILNVDTPGGSVSAINPFIEVAKKKNKPIVALCDSTCSLGYWAVCELADYIIAENSITARFGSIGVVCTFQDATEANEQKGIKTHEIYADESEHKNLSFRLAKEGKYEMIKEEHLKPLAIKFQTAVKTARPQIINEVGVFTGKTFTAEKALELKMIDAIGNIDDAIEMINVLNETKYNS